MLTRQQVRQIDKTAIDTLGVPGVILMENAGRQCADNIQHVLKSRQLDSVVVLAGSGNNGGDGYVLARHLQLRGYKVKTLIVAPRQKISGDAKVNLDALEALEGDVEFVDQPRAETLSEILTEFDVIVDAVGGTGITGSLRGILAQAVKQINIAGESKYVVAVDIPTGLDCDTGDADGEAVKADMTVTFVDEKSGFANPNSKQYTGDVIVADIGVPADVVAKIAHI